MRIKVSCNLQQGKQQVIAACALGASVAEILYRSSPIDIGEKAVITKAGALQDLGRADVQDIFDGGLRAKLVGAVQRYGTGRE